MRRASILFAMVFLAAVCLTGPCFARGASGTVVAVDGDKVIVQMESGKGAGFPVGMRDVDIKESASVSVRGRVVASSRDRITIKVVRGKASKISIGAVVEVGQAPDAGSEGIDGC